MTHSHDHAHDHSHHDHAHVHGSDSSSLLTAFLLNLAFTILEFIGGMLTNSVAISADALHDLGDSIALGFAWFMERYSQKGSDNRYSYGYQRFSLLGALVNTLVLIVGSIFVIRESIPRLLNPESTSVQGMIGFAVLGILVNGAAVLRVRKGESMNSQVITWHLLEDVLGWVTVLIVSIVLLFTDLFILDAVLSMAITFYVLTNVLRRLWQTSRLFLQGIPDRIDIDAFRETVESYENVNSLHHTHVWSLDGQRHVLTTHVVVPGSLTREAACEVKNRIAELGYEQGCEHITIEVEYEGDSCSVRREHQSEAAHVH